METPILALTRARRLSQPALSPATVSGRNMRLLVQLRWIAVTGQLITILGVCFGLGVPLPLVPMLAVVASLALVNVLVRDLLYRYPIGQTAILCALLFDVLALALQLSLSGGAANPFISLFFLQLVLGAILLEVGLAAALVGVTAAAYAVIARFGLPLDYPPTLAPVAPLLEAAGAWLGFVLTGALLVVFVTRVIRNLRARDAYVAELNQNAVEEDGIVRMGLLASGAAHELGTPLASLSVILNDWSRMPRIAADPELAGELAEMQREVARCKTIVTDILHSAGSPRGEAMQIVDAHVFLTDICTAWRPTHPATPLTYDILDLNGVALAAEPAVRQVIASLLDNAAEASPAAVALAAARTPQGLAVTILDEGPGFTAAQLAAIGEPYQSAKGPGRGLGLFLAATLARRLGGGLDAANRPDGGAEVWLTLPLLDRTVEDR